VIVAFLGAGQSLGDVSTHSFCVQQQDVIVVLTIFYLNELHVDALSAPADTGAETGTEHDVQQSRCGAALHTQNGQDENPQKSASTSPAGAWLNCRACAI